MLKVGLIGAGRMGQAHCGELAKLPDVKLTAVYDPQSSAADNMTAKYGLKKYGSARELAAADVDAVLVCSPSDCHAEGVLAVLAAGKHLFCEKPLCRTLAEAEQIMAAARNARGSITIGFVRRHVPALRKFKQFLDAGLIGRPRLAHIDLMLGAYRRQPGDWFADFARCGGAILDMLAHGIDLENWFFGEPERVYADALLLAPELPEPADYVSATVTYRNRVICNVNCGWQRFGRSGDLLEVYGDEGSLAYHWGAENLIHYPKGAEKRELAPGPAGAASPLHLQMQSLVEKIRAGQPPEVGLADGYASLKVALGMIQSVQEKRVVFF